MAQFVVSGQVDGIYDRDTDTAQTLVRRPRHSLWASARPGREGGGRRGNGQGFTAVSEASAAQCATARPIRTERYLDVRIIRRSCRGSDVNDTGCLRRAV